MELPPVTPGQWQGPILPTPVDIGEVQGVGTAPVVLGMVGVDGTYAARAAKDFAGADRIRDQIAALGVVIEDRAGKTTWRAAQ